MYVTGILVSRIVDGVGATGLLNAENADIDGVTVADDNTDATETDGVADVQLSDGVTAV